MKLANVARVLAVMAAVVAAGASATSTTQSGQQPQQLEQNGPNQPPPPRQMDPTRALGLWKSTFGAVKIAADETHGGLQSGNVQGVWVYDRRGQEVIGYFNGNLRGNVLQFTWQEPSNPPLIGEGYLVFEADGEHYTGRWWSNERDRVGQWDGWRQGAQQQGAGMQRQRRPDRSYPQGGGYGGQQYGGEEDGPPPPQQAPRRSGPAQPAPNDRTYY